MRIDGVLTTLRKLAAKWQAGYSTPGMIGWRRYLRGQRRVGACIFFGLSTLLGLYTAAVTPVAFIQSGSRAGLEVMIVAAVALLLAALLWRWRRWWWPPFRETDLRSYRGEDDPPRL
jgi:hypothetical protein